MSPRDVSKNFELCGRCITRGWRLSMLPLWMKCGPMQIPYGLCNTLRPVLRDSMGQVQVWAPFGPRMTLYGPNIVGSPSLKAVHAQRSATDYTGPKVIEKSYKPAARASVVSDQSFRYALNWQRMTQRFFIRTAESNQTVLGAHAILILSCTGSHVKVGT